MFCQLVFFTSSKCHTHTHSIIQLYTKLDVFLFDPSNAKYQLFPYRFSPLKAPSVSEPVNHGAPTYLNLPASIYMPLSAPRIMTWVLERSMRAPDETDQNQDTWMATPLKHSLCATLRKSVCSIFRRRNMKHIFESIS